MKKNKILILQGGLYTLIAALTSITTSLASDTPPNARTLVILVAAAIISGGNALKAFLSTTFSESKASEPDKPPVPVPALPLHPPWP